jgi:RNA polymerase sigma-70 factor (ECF subfamily)
MNQQDRAKDIVAIEAINRVFAEHYRSSLKTACCILRSREDAEDAVQTAYCCAFRNVDAFRGDSTFKTWITRIVVNACLAQLRQRNARLEIQGVDVSQMPVPCDTQSPEGRCYREELECAHRRAISKLPDRLREVYQLRVISEMRSEAVAGRLGMTKAAVKSRMFRAQASLRKSLQTIARRAA